MNKDKYNEMLRIKKEMNSGILFKDRIDIYRSLIEFVENNDIELAVYKEKEMIRLIEEDELFAFDYNNIGESKKYYKGFNKEYDICR